MVSCAVEVTPCNKGMCFCWSLEKVVKEAAGGESSGLFTQVVPNACSSCLEVYCVVEMLDLNDSGLQF